MGRPRYSNASFAHNRWNVGCQEPPSTAVAVAAERDARIAAQRTAKFKAAKVKAQLRPRLWEQNPHCVHCARLLQIGESSHPTYACVVGDRLACPGCVPVVQLSGAALAPIATTAEGGAL